MRGLKQEFYECLKFGFLNPIITRVKEDKDLDLQIRDNYINVYFKGNSLLKLSPINDAQYIVELHQKFTKGFVVPKELFDESSTTNFLSFIPLIKENIIRFGNSSLEVEYEQLLIRANNLEPKNNSEYFIIDRQYATETRDKFDLTGFYWNSTARKKGQTVPLCFLEIKFALNTDIKEVHNQIHRYYDYISKHSIRLAKECQEMFRQKVSLGVLNQSQERMEALEPLTFSDKVDDYEFVLVLVDYNPNSSLFNEINLSNLPFASQIKFFETGFAMWKQNVRAIK